MKAETPMVSIITPLFNSAPYIESAICSVISQTFKDWEYLIVDDCSTDDGRAITEAYCSKDSRICLIRLSENSGAGICRNRGIEESRGRYIAFLDSDDLWLPNKLETQLSFMENHNTAFSFTDYRKMNEEGILTDQVVKCRGTLSYRRQLKTNYVGCSTAVYDTYFYGKRYFPEIRKRQDFGLWLNLLENSPSARGVPEVLTHYRVRTDGLSGNKIELIRHNWNLYRTVLSFSRVKSAYYVFWNIVIKIFGKR